MATRSLAIRIGLTAVTLGTCVLAAPVSAATPSPLPHQTAPVDLGTTTHGLGGAPAAQPAPRPAIDVRTGDVPASTLPDNPGKTGLGYTDYGPVTAPSGSGTHPQTSADKAPATPAVRPTPR